MGKLKLTNKTQWDTKDLRKFVLAGLKAEVGEWVGNYVVKIKNYRGRRTGYGYYHFNEMGLCPDAPRRVARLFSDGKLYFQRHSPSWHGKKPDGLCVALEMSADEMRSMAVTLAHEADHNKNIRHRDMNDSAREVEWADRLIAKGFRIKVARPTPKKKRDLQAERAAHAEKMLAEHEKKLAREKKLVTKWRRKVRYYEKAMAVKAAARKK